MQADSTMYGPTMPSVPMCRVATAYSTYVCSVSSPHTPPIPGCGLSVSLSLWLSLTPGVLSAAQPLLLPNTGRLNAAAAAAAGNSSAQSTNLHLPTQSGPTFKVGLLSSVVRNRGLFEQPRPRPPATATSPPSLAPSSPVLPALASPP
jgi:hypothetical protein